MPEAHRAYKDMNVDKVTASADRIGASAGMLVRLIIEAKHHPLQGVRSGLGVVSLARQFGSERVEAACLRALEHGAPEEISQSVAKLIEVVVESGDSILIRDVGQQTPVRSEGETVEHFNPTVSGDDKWALEFGPPRGHGAGLRLVQVKL